MSEKEKMLAGLLYDANDGQLIMERHRAKTLCAELNRIAYENQERRNAILKELLGLCGKTSRLNRHSFVTMGTTSKSVIASTSITTASS